MYEVASAVKDDLRLIVYVDEDAQDPRDSKYCDPFGHLFCEDDPRSKLGDEQGDPEAFLYELAQKCDPILWKKQELLRKILDDPEEETEAFKDAFGEIIRQAIDAGCVLLRVRFRDHGCQCEMTTLPYEQRWADDETGWIYLTHDEIRREWSIPGSIPDGAPIPDETLERVRNGLRGVVEEYSDYLSGNVYGFRLVRLERDEDGEVDEDEEAEEVDSCWGFYGDDWESNGMADYVGNEIDAETAAELVRAL